MSSTPIFEQLQLEFIEQGKFSGLLIGPPRPKRVFGLPTNDQPLPNMDDTIVMEAVVSEPPSAVSARIAEVQEEEKQHVFPIRKNNHPLMKISATVAFDFFDKIEAA